MRICDLKLRHIRIRRLTLPNLIFEHLSNDNMKKLTLGRGLTSDTAGQCTLQFRQHVVRRLWEALPIHLPADNGRTRQTYGKDLLSRLQNDPLQWNPIITITPG